MWRRWHRHARAGCMRQWRSHRGHCAASRSESCPWRSAFLTVDRKRSGCSWLSVSANARQNGFTVSQCATGSKGTTSMQPLPPVVRQNEVRPRRRNWSRTSTAAFTTRESHVVARIEVEHDPVRMQRIGLGRAPGMQLDSGDLRHRDQPVRIVDHEIRLPVGLALANRRRQRAVAMLLEEVLAADPLRTPHNGERPTRQSGQCMIGDRASNSPPGHAW